METSNVGRTKTVDGITSPHSLGKLIEWKLGEFRLGLGGCQPGSPHSLGKLIEWKLA